MKAFTYQELNKTLRELNRERNEIQTQIDENQLGINEAQRLTKEILEREDDDFKVFSPRRAGDFHKAELEQFAARRESLERQNSQLVVKRDKLDRIIYVIQLVLEENQESEDRINGTDHDQSQNNEEQINDSNHEQSGSNEFENRDISAIASDSIYEEIKRLKHKIELSSKFIVQDPVRAKQELERIGKRMDKLLMKSEDVSHEK